MTGPVRVPPGKFLKDDPTLFEIPMEPATDNQIPITAIRAREALALARMWNRFGGLFVALPKEVGVEAAELIAVLCAESSGVCKGLEGRPMIRFEVHMLWLRWAEKVAGRRNTFNNHFAFCSMQRWRKHRYRAEVTSEWKLVHRDQSNEWEALDIGRRLDHEEALRCTSWGLCQIMGFNHSTVGYPSASSMCEAFADDKHGPRFQIIAFFDLLRNSSRSKELLGSLARNDFDGFARLYNGPAQAEAYGAKIRRLYEAFRGLRR